MSNAAQPIFMIPSAAVTATNTTADINVAYLNVLALDVNITALTGTGASYQLFVDRKGADGVYYPIYSGSAQTAAGVISVNIGVGASTNVELGATIRIREVIAGTTPSVTRSLSLIGE